MKTMTRMTMKTTMRLLSLVLVLIGVGSGIAACDNTIRGAGQDIRDTSNAVTDQTRR